MPQPDYEYTGLLVATWDLFRGDTSNWDDRFFYKDVILKSGQPALDVGCGTGRLLLDYLQQGIDIDGVDNSPEMLAVCHEKAQALGLQPNTYLQPMQALDLPRKYRTIFVSSSSFQLLIDLGDATEAMRRFFNYLVPGGTLVMPFMKIYTGEATEGIVTEDWHPTGERVRPADGATMRRRSRSTYDIPNQLEHSEEVYEIVLDGKIIASEYHKSSPGVRWYTQEQAVKLYRDVGFTNLRLVHGFSVEYLPAKAEEDLVSILGTRPEA